MVKLRWRVNQTNVTTIFRYIFLLMEAMIDAGVHMGFSRDTASTLVHHTVRQQLV